MKFQLPKEIAPLMSLAKLCTLNDRRIAFRLKYFWGSGQRSFTLREHLHLHRGYRRPSRQVIVVFAMGALGVSRKLVAEKGLFRKWWHRHPSANLAAHSRDNSIRDSFSMAGRVFTVESGVRKLASSTYRSCIRFFKRLADGRHTRSISKSFDKRPKVLNQKRRRSPWCGFCGIEMDMTEDNLILLKKSKTVDEVSGLNIRSGKPSTGCYGELCMRNLKSCSSFFQRAGPLVSVQSKDKKNPSSSDPILTIEDNRENSMSNLQFDESGLEGFMEGLVFEKRCLSTGEKHLILQFSVGNLPQAVTDNEVNKESHNPILMKGEISELAMEDENCSQAQESPKQVIHSASMVRTSDLGSKLSFLEAGVPRGDSGFVAAIELAARECTPDTDDSKAPQKATSAERGELAESFSNTRTHAAQNQFTIKDFAKPSEKFCTGQAIEYAHNNSDKSLNGSESIHTSQVSASTSGCQALHSKRKRKLRELLGPPLQFENVLEEDTKVEEGKHWNLLDEGNSGASDVQIENKKVPICLQDKKRKLEAYLEIFCSYETSLHSPTITSKHTRKRSLSAKEKIFFELGVDAGLMFVLSARERKKHQLHQSLKTSEALVNDLRHKLESSQSVPHYADLQLQKQMDEKQCPSCNSQKQRRSSRISYSKSENTYATFSKNDLEDCEVADDDDKSEASILTVDHNQEEGDMSNLEKELEAEFELMELNFKCQKFNDYHESLSGLGDIYEKVQEKATRVLYRQDERFK